MRPNTQIFRTTTTEELRHIATIWYDLVHPAILNLSYAVCGNWVELHIVYADREQNTQEENNID